jgi:hypothetical protein
MKIISVIKDPQVIEKILNHLGLPTVSPCFDASRAPPQMEFDY